MKHSVKTTFGGRELIIETGHMARQAGGSVTVRCGDTIVLVTATVSEKPREKCDFLPLTVDYVEKTFAAGKIPGGFFKREGRPSEIETLTSRFIDRSIRPLFPKGFTHEIQVIATVLSADQDHESDVLAMIGASAALVISNAPFEEPIAGIRVGRLNGEMLCNPTPEEAEGSDIDLFISASKEALVMVEGGATEVPEADMVKAILYAHEEIKKIIDVQKELKKKVGRETIEWTPMACPADLEEKIVKQAKTKVEKAIQIAGKQERREALSSIKEEVLAEHISEEDDGTVALQVGSIWEDLIKKSMRHRLLEKGIRLDGRDNKTVRPITCEVGLLPRTHGSALFTRGETQALVVATLGSSDDEQRIDALKGESKKRFMLHYNFPPFSVGEVRFLRGPSRREIGHGALAERSLRSVLPSEEEFPYTIRIVSEILESNGSSSMATVCGASLSMMDAGIPIKAQVAGVAMGLVKEGNQVAVLTDILGDEDHLGDMDFKVAGTAKGVTALQMDIKIEGLTEDLLRKALVQAYEARMHILEKMNAVIEKPRPEVAEHAPKFETFKIRPERIKDLIGPGGKHIKEIVETTGAKIDVENDGTVRLFAASGESRAAAMKKIRDLTAEAELGKIYQGKVRKIMEYGAFVEIMPGCDGLLHISQIDVKRIDKVTDVLKEGDEIPVKVIRIERDGKVALSRKDALKETPSANA